MAMDARKQRILEAIVALYANGGEPVGSGLLANYFDMALSSATLRKDVYKRQDQAQDLPVLRPCIGMDKIEIINISRKIGTFETSIEPVSYTHLDVYKRQGMRSYGACVDLLVEEFLTNTTSCD